MNLHKLHSGLHDFFSLANSRYFVLRGNAASSSSNSLSILSQILILIKSTSKRWIWPVLHPGDWWPMEQEQWLEVCCCKKRCHLLCLPLTCVKHPAKKRRWHLIPPPSGSKHLATASAPSLLLCCPFCQSQSSCREGAEEDRTEDAPWLHSCPHYLRQHLDLELCSLSHCYMIDYQTGF